MSKKRELKKEHNISECKETNKIDENIFSEKEEKINKEEKDNTIIPENKNEEIKEKREEIRNETTEKGDKTIDTTEKEIEELKEETEKEKYEEKVKELENKLSEKSESYLRLMAEFDNYKKRIAREYEKMVDCANEKLILELIGVKESFELALKHAEKNKEYNQLLEGIKLIYNKFDSILSGHGLSWFGEIGEEFDPQLHDALMKTPHSEIEEGHIAEIYEKGYKLKNRIIKHAKVIVSCGKPVDTTASVNITSSSNNDEDNK